MGRYAVGIDLGTTSSALAYGPAGAGPAQVVPLPIPQAIGRGATGERMSLPSFIALVEGTEEAEIARLPWDDKPARLVGQYAREFGRFQPDRMIASSKSWLCHGGVDRTAKILPWGATATDGRLSPVECAGIFLDHMRRAWNDAMDEPLEKQEVVIGVPASFDPVARELTSKAAVRAGIVRHTLLEEPQAAFYAWLAENRLDFRERLAKFETVLVVDVGGGTTDFTLVRVKHGENSCELERVAVGNHILLGGDNMDLALARRLEEKFGGSLDRRRFAELVFRARDAKEALLSPDGPAECSVEVHGSGRSVVAGSRAVPVSRAEVEELLLKGFFADLGWGERPRGAASALREWGLPYESDPRITLHMKEFLAAHAGPERPPDALLLHGGVFYSPVLRARMKAALEALYGGKPVVALELSDLSSGVSRGAACFAQSRDGSGVRIRSGSPHAYYVGLEPSAGGEERALCVLRRDTDPGAPVPVERVFQATANEPCLFPLFLSSTRADRAGEVVTVDPDGFRLLPPLVATLKFGKRPVGRKVPVRLSAELTEVGTLRMALRALESGHRFDLEFNLRDRTLDADALKGTGDAGRAAALADLARAAFETGDEAAVRGLGKRLEAEAGEPRSDWDAGLLRALYGALLEAGAHRARDRAREETWLNLAGFALRPGFGYPNDEWRAAQAYAAWQAGAAHGGSKPVRIQWLVFLRRAAGGLTPGQQTEIFRANRREMMPRGDRLGDWNDNERSELVRLFGALERAPVGSKIELAEWLLERAEDGMDRPLYGWLVGRLGARALVHGLASDVIPPDQVGLWLKYLLGESPAILRAHPLALASMIRRTGDRALDLKPAVYDRAYRFLEELPADEATLSLARGETDPDAGQQTLLVGDTIPRGLSLK